MRITSTWWAAYVLRLQLQAVTLVCLRLNASTDFVTLLLYCQPEGLELGAELDQAAGGPSMGEIEDIANSGAYPEPR